MVSNRGMLKGSQIGVVAARNGIVPVKGVLFYKPASEALPFFGMNAREFREAFPPETRMAVLLYEFVRQITVNGELAWNNQKQEYMGIGNVEVKLKVPIKDVRVFNSTASLDEIGLTSEYSTQSPKETDAPSSGYKFRL